MVDVLIGDTGCEETISSDEPSEPSFLETKEPLFTFKNIVTSNNSLTAFYSIPEALDALIRAKKIETPTHIDAHNQLGVEKIAYFTGEFGKSISLTFNDQCTQAMATFEAGEMANKLTTMFEPLITQAEEEWRKEGERFGFTANTPKPPQS